MANKQQHHPPARRHAVDHAVSAHACRISIALYQRVLNEIEKITAAQPPLDCCDSPQLS